MGCSHGPYFWIERRNEDRRSSFVFQCQTNLVKQIAFSFTGTITTENKRINRLFEEGVTHLVDTQNQRTPSDFITVAEAQQQILLQTGRAVSHSTAARWIAQNNLGCKLPGHKG